ncbi:MAG: arginine decarboxylase [Sphingobacteriales bacterium]|jgi:arginine decarboxylase
MQSYTEFLDHNVGFPQSEFKLEEDQLLFHDIPIMDLIETYGTPLRFTFLPIISKKIQQAKLLFQTAILKNDYRGSYTYCYCTKSSHFKHIVEETLKNEVHLETSSAYDIPIIKYLAKNKKIGKDITVICNGFKRPKYLEYVADLVYDGFTNVMPVLDNKEEFNYYDNNIEASLNLGIRVATEEKPNSETYTSRLGIRADEINDFYKKNFAKHSRFKLKLFHFFVNDGISDTPYYWNELEKCVNMYCKLKKINPDLEYLDIGGGMPFKTSLAFDFDYEYMTNEIVLRIKEICKSHNVLEPNIITEFGKYTVAESQATIFKVLGRKQQNDREKWLMLDGSFITTLPDIWATRQKYILLPINNYDAEYERVYLGGITCDGMDFYNQEEQDNQVFMPKTRKSQYIGFFHTGAYQEVLSGVGGIHHCLIPTPKHVLISHDDNQQLTYEVFNEEQTYVQALKILGYS